MLKTIGEAMHHNRQLDNKRRVKEFKEFKEIQERSAESEKSKLLSANSNEKVN